MIYRYSSVDTSYRCLEKFNLQYVKRLGASQPSADLAFGTAMHTTLFLCLSDKKNDPVTTFNLVWGIRKFDELEYGRNNWETLKIIGEDFIMKFFRLHAKNYKHVYLEKNLNFSIGNHSFNGTPDFVGEFKGVPSIVDFKTSGAPYPKDKILVSEQLYVYAHAVRSILKYDVKQIVYTVFIKNKESRIQTIACPLDENKMNLMLANVNEQCNLLELLTHCNTFTKNRNSCLMGERKCEYYNLCYKEVSNEESRRTTSGT